MAIVNELITKFGFIGDLAPQETFNANLKASIGLLAGLGAAIAGSAAGVAGWVTSVSLLIRWSSSLGKRAWRSRPFRHWVTRRP